MFKSKTLFIVGAGASCEAGLPSGHDLKRRISDQLEINVIDGAARSGTYEALMHKSMALKDSFVNYKNAAKQISRAMPLAISIDNYLDAHAHDSRIELCGKLAIVEAILESEKKSSLYPAESLGHTIKFRNIENTWYTAFFKVLT